MKLKDSYARPDMRPLSVYAFDPNLGRRLNNYMTIKVRYERLEPGPVGHKIAVIDYDISNKSYYQPVDLDNHYVLIGGGLEPSESDPRFHQQMVYAVASETIHRFEYALGRETKWRRLDKPPSGAYGDRLRIFPHAFQQANAFYDAERRAVFFGYFAASGTDTVMSLPGQTVFTCLSHDVVAHEMTHALVDGVRPHFTEATSFDTPAFHEAFADIVALFQHFAMRDAMIETIRRTGGLFYRSKLAADVAGGEEAQISGELTQDNPLVGLAQQFGDAMGMRRALRSALGTKPNTKELDTTFEPHLRGSILVAAVFDAYFSIYVARSRDLLRMAGAAAMATPGDLHPDLAARLCDEAIKSADHMLNMCIRALEYCPPVDITYGEFLRALITADSDLVPDDKWGYRAFIIEAFRSRGIVPEDVASYSEESLRWRGPDVSGEPLPACKGLLFDVLHETGEDHKVSARLNQERRDKNHALLKRYGERHSAKLGLVRRQADHRFKIDVESCHPVHRVSPNGRVQVDFVVQYMQAREVPIDPKDKTQTMTFRGGATVIFDHYGKVRYVIQKSLFSKGRLARQRDYVAQQSEMTAFAIYAPDHPTAMNFAAVHRGY
jgi:hypothetical protein